MPISIQFPKFHVTTYSIYIILKDDSHTWPFTDFKAFLLQCEKIFVTWRTSKYIISVIKVCGVSIAFSCIVHFDCLLNLRPDPDMAALACQN